MALRLHKAAADVSLWPDRSIDRSRPHPHIADGVAHMMYYVILAAALVALIVVFFVVRKKGQ